MPKSEKLVEFEARLAAAKKAKVKNYALCKLLAEAVKKQAEADAALEANYFDAAERLENEVRLSPLQPLLCTPPLFSIVFLPLPLLLPLPLCQVKEVEAEVKELEAQAGMMKPSVSVCVLCVVCVFSLNFSVAFLFFLVAHRRCKCWGGRVGEQYERVKIYLDAKNSFQAHFCFGLF